MYLKVRQLIVYTFLDERNSDRTEDSGKIHQQIIGLLSRKRTKEYLNVKNNFIILNTLGIGISKCRRRISGSFNRLNCSVAYIENYYFVQYSLEHHLTLLKLYYLILLDHILNHIIPILVSDNISLMFCTMVETDGSLLPGMSEIRKSPDQ
ncbi:hypothetical protein ALC57_17761 [Trachymyrmex cornetzi]|uniref:Uncharacterized protein n=1 Tax=Trachymyrmex cornetzi TaxID=471704 RepID=A0A195DB41_9HYME|nr:hypothetical protein ALC57_17761 [Trachymyrmex cornetzi]